MTLYTKIIQHPEYPHLDVVFEASQETEYPDSHFEFPEDVNFALNDSNEAAWFSACVKVTLKDTLLFGHAYLGCCSYQSFDEFMQDEYFKEMVSDATDDLIEELSKSVDVINNFVADYNKAG